MNEYTGKAKTIEEALRAAAQAAMADEGPDAMVHFTVKEVKGLYGGFAGFDEKEVTIIAEESVKQELCGDVATYKAYQSQKAVLLVAHGSHPTSGYRVWLEKKPIDIYPPEFALRHTTPTGHVLQVITPFIVETSFPATGPIKVVKVEDAKGIHTIPVLPMELEYPSR